MERKNNLIELFVSGQMQAGDLQVLRQQIIQSPQAAQALVGALYRQAKQLPSKLPVPYITQHLERLLGEQWPQYPHTALPAVRQYLQLIEQEEEHAYELIAAYANKELSDAQSEALAKALDKQPETAEALHIASILKAEEVRQFRQKMEALQKPMSRRRWLYTAVASSAACLLAVWVMFNWPAPTHETLAQGYWPSAQIMAHLSPTMSGGVPAAEAAEALTKAYQKYRGQTYEEALEILQNSPADSAEDEDTYANQQILCGMCHFQLEEYEQAVKYFQPIADANTSYRPQAEWLLALSHLASGDVSTAEEQLQAIADDKDSYYAGQAEELSEKLKKMN